MFCLYKDAAALLRAATTEATASQQPSFGLLRQAWVCLELSNRVYETNLGAKEKATSIEFPASLQELAASGLPQKATCTLFDKAFIAPIKDRPTEATFWGLWQVESLGFVVAIRGASFDKALDGIAKPEFSGRKLTGQLEPEGLELHETLFNRALDAADDIVRALQKHACRTLVKPCRLLLTGASLIA